MQHIRFHGLQGVLHRETTLAALGMRFAMIDAAVVIIWVSRAISAVHLSLQSRELEMLQVGKHRVIGPIKKVDVSQHVYLSLIN